MAVTLSQLRRLAAATAAAAALHASEPASSTAQDFCPPGRARYCENAHVDDAYAEDCDDGWGITSFLRDWHEDHHRRRRDKRRHLYYKAQNAHYDLFYPQCPPDWSMTHGYHVTQWRPFPGECDPRLTWPSSSMPPTFTPGLLPAPDNSGTTPPAAPPGESGTPSQPYSPPPVPEANPSAAPVEDTEPVIQLMNAERMSIDSIELLPPADISLKPSGIILLDSTGDDWSPTKPH